jgi:ribosomal protein S18 acetylase RimI-like enzyme
MDVGAICPAAGGVGMTVRDLVAGDCAAVREALEDCGVFSQEEVRVAMEMVASGLEGGYSLPAIEIDGKVRGYACIGKAPLTVAAWYIYWICVHPSRQGTGIGRRLQARIEQVVRQAGGDRLVLETSGRADYEPTRRFYRCAGFTEAGRIPDFYKPGDDCVVYYKMLGGTADHELRDSQSGTGDV